MPLDKAAVWLLPLVESARHEVESAALAHLGPDDPDMTGPVHLVISTGLRAWSDHWISQALDWVAPDEVEAFFTQLRVIATVQTAATQRTQHAAKQLLKQQGLWRPLPHEST